MYSREMLAAVFPLLCSDKQLRLRQAFNTWPTVCGCLSFGAACDLSVVESSKSRGLSMGTTCRAERSGGGGFLAGFVVGGTIFGALGFLFAPQVRACPKFARNLSGLFNPFALIFSLHLGIRYLQPSCQRISDSSCPGFWKKRRKTPRPPNRSVPMLQACCCLFCPCSDASGNSGAL